MEKEDVIVEGGAKIFSAEYEEDGAIEIYYHKKPIPEQNPADRIELLITRTLNDSRGFLMTAQEAMDIICGLSDAVGHAMQDATPLCVEKDSKE